MTHPLRQYRERHGLSAKDFSRQLELSRQSLHRIEAGEQTPSAELLLRINRCTAGEVTPNDVLLLGSTDQPLCAGDIDAPSAATRHVSVTPSALPAGSAQ